MKLNEIDKLWQLLEIALEDLAKCEADPKYVIDMSCWYQEYGDGCHVCLAGAVLAQRLKPNKTHYLEYMLPAYRQLKAIDHLRLGRIDLAGICLGKNVSGRWPIRYDEHWRQNMKNMLLFLKEQDI